MRRELGVWLAVCVVAVVGLMPAAASHTLAQGTGQLTPVPLKPGERLKVLAAETFLADIARNVAGDQADIRTLMPLGADPHAFEPTPQDLVKIADSQVLIINGAGFEEWLQQKMLETGSGAEQVIEAAAGLQGRQHREGEVAVMSDADLADSICVSLRDDEPQPATSATNAGDASDLPAEDGVFSIGLQPQNEGKYFGYFKYSTDEPGAFQVATDARKVSVLRAADSSQVAVDKTLALSCGGLQGASIVTLEKDTRYLIVVTGANKEQATLAIGPAGGQHHHAGDPHFWLDPLKVMKYVENIRDGLSQADPQGADVYGKNADAYIAQLAELDGWIKDQVAQVPPERRLMVTNHESFGYFADEYGFRIVGTVLPSVSTEAQPSAQQMARLEDRVKSSNAIAVFLETGSSRQMADQLARDTGIAVVSDLYTHSISASDGPAPTYVDMMKYDVLAIVDALK